MNTANQVYEVVQTLPKHKQIEILDFAQYLAERTRQQAVANVSFSAFIGTLSGSQNFNDDPVELQRAIRDDWH